MAQQPKKEHEHEENLVEVEPVKQIEIETKDLVVSSRIWIYIIIGILAYMTFIVIPDIKEKMVWMEKDLSSVLVQSERYQLGTRVFAKGNACAECHLDPDYLISGLHAKYPSFADLKGFMKVGHQRYFTMAQEMPEAELMEIYRTLK